METKLIQLGEVKLATTEGKLSFTGYGAIFGNSDAYNDVIVKGAFETSLKRSDPPLMFLNHRAGELPIGKWISVKEDDTGLICEGVFLDTQSGRDTYAAVKAGAISGLSIGYRARDYEDQDGKRLLKSVDLLEVSVVTFPANDRARILDVKSLNEPEDFIQTLIRHGLTADEAKNFVERAGNTFVNKYQRSRELVAAKTLLSKIQGDQ